MLDVHTDALAACEIQRVDGIPVTSPAGTAFDIVGRRRDLVAGVARVDAVMNATDVKVRDIRPSPRRIPASAGWRS